MGVYQIIYEDPKFLNEILLVYQRFLSGDWGLDEKEDAEEIDLNNRRPQWAMGYYMTSWGEVWIKRDHPLTTAFLPFER